MNPLLSPAFIFISTLGQAPATSQPSPFVSLLPILLIVAVMYFIMIRPQQKKQKAHKAMIEAIKNGDEVVTAGGMYGTVSGIDDKRQTLYLKVSGDVKIKVERYAIARVLTDAEKS